MFSLGVQSNIQNKEIDRLFLTLTSLEVDNSEHYSSFSVLNIQQS